MENADFTSQIVATINGPGEASGWLRPFARALRQRDSRIRLAVALMPCAFSSGAERRVLESYPEVAAVSPTRDTLRFALFGGRPPEALNAPLPGAVLHFGGEPFVSWLLARRLGLPCMAYAERPFAIQSWFKKVLTTVPEALPKRRQNGKFKSIGDMMVDAARQRCPNRDSSGHPPVIGLFPGSRPYQVKYMLPFYARVASIVSSRLGEMRWMVAKSDFLDWSFLQHPPAVEPHAPLKTDALRWSETDGQAALVSDAGIRLEICPQEAVLARARAVLTVPGSCTAQIAALGVPMALCFPTYWGEIHPLPGPLQHLGRLPLAGRYLKRAVAHAYLRRLGALALPNKKSGRMIVPELVGPIDAERAARVLMDILESDTAAIERQLLAVMGEPGAAERLVDETLALFNGARPAAARSSSDGR